MAIQTSLADIVTEPRTLRDSTSLPDATPRGTRDTHTPGFDSVYPQPRSSDPAGCIPSSGRRLRSGMKGLSLPVKLKTGGILCIQCTPQVLRLPL